MAVDNEALVRSTFTITNPHPAPAEGKIGKVLGEFKRGTLRSGGSGKKVAKRKQAVAIALSEAREAGAKIPKKRK